MKIRAFLREESGAVTADYVVLLSAVVILGLATVGTVGRGVLSAADDLASGIGNAALLSFTAGTGSGGAAGDTGSGDATDGGSADSSDGDADDSSSDSSGSTGSGNPGNDKDVGRAGENPNGQGGWGGGSHGRAN